MTAERAEPTLSEAQAKVRTDHACIRGLLDELAALAREHGAETAEAPAARLTQVVWKLLLIFEEHMAMEERDLAPLFQRLDVWGTVQVRRMQEEHQQQRATLRGMVDECDGKTKSPSAILHDVRWLVESFRRDMDHEEERFDAVRDDGFVVDQCTG